MATASLKSHKFRTEREAGWKRLELLLLRIENRSLKSLSDEDMIALPGLYRATLSALSVARATSLDQDVVAYLESLTARAYFVIYGNQSSIFERINIFFKTGWPLAVQSLKRETLASLIITVLGVLIAYGLVHNNPDWYFSFVPEGLAGDRNPVATAEQLKETLYHQGEHNGLMTFATFLFSHNSRIAIFAFALGFAFAIPSVALILYNGCILGAFIALFASKGLGFEVGGWLIIHGTTEIYAIILAGASGIKIGWTVAFPGKHNRMDAAAKAGKETATVLGGVVVMLFIAGLLEGVGRQLITTDWVRYSIGLSSLALWLTYFYMPRAAHDLNSEDWEQEAHKEVRS
ncbi:MAG: stage II sporulation protein M [Robiginitomaculum sp.]